MKITGLRGIVNSPLYSVILALSVLAAILTSIAWWTTRRREQHWRRILLTREETWQAKLRHRLRTTMALERQLAFLRAFVARMTLTIHIDDFLAEAMDMLGAAMQVDAILVYSCNERYDTLLLRAHQGIDPADLPRWQQIDRGDGATGKAAEGTLVYVPSAESGIPGSPTVIALPLIVKGRTIGVLTLLAEPLREFAPEEISLLETIADYLAMGTENWHLYQNLRQYAHQVTKAQENERRRIARELHDSTLQSLIAIVHHIECFLREHQNLQINDSRFLWDLEEQVKDTINEVRYFSHHLRPAILDDLGLMPAVDWLLDEVEREYRIKASLIVTGKPLRFIPDAEIGIFRIIQEAVNNVVRHSGATLVQVKLCFGDHEVVASIRDNGRGFKVPAVISDLARKGKLGLAGMEERVNLLRGRLLLSSEPDHGSLVEVSFPYLGNAEKSDDPRFTPGNIYSKHSDPNSGSSFPNLETGDA